MRKWSRVVPSVAALFLLDAAARAADPMFNQGVLHEVRVVMDAADWRALRETFRTNQYYAANVSIDGEVIEQVGVRSRGKGSRSGEKPAIKTTRWSSTSRCLSRPRRTRAISTAPASSRS